MPEVVVYNFKMFTRTLIRDRLDSVGYLPLQTLYPVRIQQNVSLSEEYVID
jgi:hypothetical protein